MLVFAFQDEAPLIALGYSLGANIMLKYVGEGAYSSGKNKHQCCNARSLTVYPLLRIQRERMCLSMVPSQSQILLILRYLNSTNYKI
jgi:predicted alpha/beta-fold hydrolase